MFRVVFLSLFAVCRIILALTFPYLLGVFIAVLASALKLLFAVCRIILAMIFRMFRGVLATAFFYLFAVCRIILALYFRFCSRRVASSLAFFLLLMFEHGIGRALKIIEAAQGSIRNIEGLEATAGPSIQHVAEQCFVAEDRGPVGRQLQRCGHHRACPPRERA